MDSFDPCIAALFLGLSVAFWFAVLPHLFVWSLAIADRAIVWCVRAMLWCAWQTIGALAWLLTETAFRADCRGPFRHVYRWGCSLYGLWSDMADRFGFYTPSPRAAYR